VAKDPIMEQVLSRQVSPMLRELRRRAVKYRDLDAHYEGSSPIPSSIARARITNAYRMLMPLASAPWGALVVDSVQDRLEVTGIRSPDEQADELVWDVWQDNAMDAEAKLAHATALIGGRAFATIWPDSDGRPRITTDTPEQMIVQYREGSRRDRVCAMRAWVDEDETEHLTIYRPDYIFKLQKARAQQPSTTDLAFLAADTWWEPRAFEDEWVLENPFGLVPVVELPVNRRLKPGTFGYARGEFEHATGLIDRINLLTFLGLVVAFWMGFPLRGVIGEELLKDDNGNVLAPFDAHAGGIFQLENPEAKIVEYNAADRKNLSIIHELDQFAAVTKTPRHYMPMESGMANLSADAIRASEGGLHAKVRGLHKPFLSEGWEEVLRVAGLMLPQPVELSPRAELQWADHESRSLAERADAASKLKDIIPWQAVAEMALQASADQVQRWQSERTGDAFAQVLTAVTQPPPSLPVAA